MGKGEMDANESIGLVLGFHFYVSMNVDMNICQRGGGRVYMQK